MNRISVRLVAVFFCLVAAAASAQGDGLLAKWTFDEGPGDVARDSSGNERNVTLHGATRVRQGDGFALSFDGKDDYARFNADPAMALTGPVSVEAWIKPARKAEGITPIAGQDMQSYLLTLYATDLCYWYIGRGGNKVSTRIALNEWNHIAATFDGERISLWLNGRQAASRVSQVKEYPQRNAFTLGRKGPPTLPHFKGLIDTVRLYNRALTDEEIQGHFLAEGARHGVAMRNDAAMDPAETARFFRAHGKGVSLKEIPQGLLLANERMGLQFEKSDRGFEISRLYGVARDQDFLTSVNPAGYRDLFEVRMTLDPKHVGRDDRLKEKGSLFNIVDEMAGEAFSIGSHAAKSVEWRREGDASETTLHLQWKGMDVQEDQGALDVAVRVTLRAGDPFSRWRITVTNRSARYGLERVRFPIIPLAPIGHAEDTVFILPRGRGGLIEDPFHAETGFGQALNSTGAFYPHNFNMQFQAIYNRASETGLYLGTRDGTPHLMNIQIVNTPQEIGWRPGHFPPNTGFAEEDYALPYDCVVGPFEGDWFDACRIYRQWALKQTWCRKGPLSQRSDIPTWYKETPLFFYTSLADSAEGTHDIHQNLQIAADHFREWLRWAGVRMPLNFYTWHEYDPTLTVSNMPFHYRRMNNVKESRWRGLPSTYEPSGNYPEIPAQEKFSEVCASLRREGGMVCPYIALEIFDQGPTENAPYAAEAKPHIARDLYGAIRLWARLRFWQPCAWTPWWRQRLSETCTLMLRNEHVGGFYLDVMQGSAPPCYWTPHGHSAGGGSCSTAGMHGLCEAIYNAVKATDPEAITTGENAAENMIDVTDGSLTFTLRADAKAPIFAAVYQDYFPRYGLKLSTGKGWQDRLGNVYGQDAFFIECASLFLEGAQVGRLSLRPRDTSLSFQNPDHKEMIDFLSRIVGYYNQAEARKFLVYGQIMRPLAFAAPSEMPLLPYTAPLVKTPAHFPALMSGVFKAQDGDLGVFIANASGETLDFQARLDFARHGLAPDTVADVDALAWNGKGALLQRAVKHGINLNASLPARSIILYRVKPRGR